jgi:hypothetical protein
MRAIVHSHECRQVSRKKAPTGTKSGLTPLHPLGGRSNAKAKLCNAAPLPCDGEHKTTLLFFRKLRQQSRRRRALSGFAFVPNPCRVPHGIGWSSKTAMKRLTSLAHSRSPGAQGGMPVPTGKV